MCKSLFRLNKDTLPTWNLGGKAEMLVKLSASGYAVPPFIVVGAEAFDSCGRCLIPDLAEQVVAAGLQGKRFAVRSSAVGEDGAASSCAGLFETELSVPLSDLIQASERIHASGKSERVQAYAALNGIKDLTQVSVVIQEQVVALFAGVGFGVNLRSGNRRAETISAVRGGGESLVSGESNSDDYFVEEGRIVSSQIPGCVGISEAEVIDISRVVRDVSDRFGFIADVEWAIDASGLKILQARPVTTLSRLPDTTGMNILWDNSNIVESYPGITTPLTFSFIRDIYRSVYQQFCAVLGVESAMIEANSTRFEMLGLIRGRVYYNLRNWYSLLMMLPMYDLNASFMEAMMGVKEPLRTRPDIVPSRRPKIYRIIMLCRSLFGSFMTLQRQVRDFQKRFNAVIVPLESRDFTREKPETLAALYQTMAQALLPAWKPPLVNDFFAMIFYGLLRKLTAKWKLDPNGHLQNDLLSGEGGLISAEPVKCIRKLLAQIEGVPDLSSALKDSDESFFRKLKLFPDIQKTYDQYMHRFAARCIGELKLETQTYRENPHLFLDILRAYSRQGPTAALVEKSLRNNAEYLVKERLKGIKLKRLLFFYVLKQTRKMVKNRENLRFERTRLFDVTRRIFLALGAGFQREGILPDQRDIFYLSKEEIFDFIHGTAVSTDLGAIVKMRQKTFADYIRMPPPSERFETFGAVNGANTFQRIEDTVPDSSDGDVLKGFGCGGGKVRGRVRVVEDPHETEGLEGAILVTVRTDPGWAPLFPVCAGVLVERGSILSHAAILTRELGIASIVGIDHLTAKLKTGDEIEMDGSTGIIRLLERS